MADAPESLWSCLVVGAYTTDSRPDLFGFDTAGRRTVAEAKGRARFRTALIGQMENQKNAVGAINGSPRPFALGRRLGSVMETPNFG